MSDEDEARPMTALDDLAFDVSDMAIEVRAMRSQQARLEIKLDTVLECFRILGAGLEASGYKLMDGQEDLPDRLDKLREDE